MQLKYMVNPLITPPKKLEKVQYYVVFIITRSMKGTSRGHLDKELGIAFLNERR